MIGQGPHILPAFPLKQAWKRFEKRLERCQEHCSEKAVHALRVETRRLLSMVDSLRTVLPPAGVKKARRLLKRHLDSFAELRDTQVQVRQVERELRAFPAIKPFYQSLVKREHQLARKAVKRVKRVRQSKLRKLILELREELRTLRRNPRRLSRKADALWQAVDGAFREVTARREKIDPQKLATLHQTRLAFKKFRYLAEALASPDSADAQRQLRRMQAYQTLLGEVQDADVLLARAEAFAGRRKSFAGFLRDLRRRRTRLVRRYLKSAGKLDAFWHTAGPAPAIEITPGAAA
jgi:CHAD domain-containing protein